MFVIWLRFKGHTLREIAEMMQVDVKVLTRWIEKVREAVQRVLDND
jgi:transposase